jgi:hypothetical protein
MAEYMGKDGFVWWQGVVEDRHDPLYLGRCRVRILGWHTEDKTDMPTESLPWAYPVQPITSAAQTGVGISPTGPVEGTWVVGFYRDGEQAQEPVFFGTLGGIPEVPGEINVGFNDPRADTIEFHPDLEKGPYKKKDAGNKLTFSRSAPNIPYPPKNMSHYKTVDKKEIPVGDEGFKSFISTKSAIPGTVAFHVELEEYANRSTYPREEYLNEATTPRAARGEKGQTAAEYASGIVGQKQSNWVALNGIAGFSTASLKDIRTIGEDGIERITSTKPYEWFEPAPYTLYGAEYPYNHVHESESGHLIEIDDTPGKERLHRYHRTGTYEEIGALGQRIVKVVNENYHMGLNNDYTAIMGNKYENIAGKLDIVSGDYFHTSSGAVDMRGTSFNFDIGGAGNISVNPEGITLNAGTGTMILAGQRLEKNFNDAAGTDTMRGAFTQEIGGLYSLETGSFALTTRASAGITTGGDLVSVITGSVNETIVNMSIPPALAARNTKVTYGDINFNTANFGIGNFNVDIGPMLPLQPGGTGFIAGGTSLSATPISFSVTQGGLSPPGTGPVASSFSMSPLGVFLTYGTSSISITAAGISLLAPIVTVGDASSVTTISGSVVSVGSSSTAVTAVAGTLVTLN